MGPVTLAEVKEAVFKMGATKAPGPNGMNGQFYQHHWEIIQQEVYQTVNNFFALGTLDPSLNRTHIILIPKVPNPESIKQYRPISLCNFSYKGSIDERNILPKWRFGMQTKDLDPLGVGKAC